MWPLFQRFEWFQISERESSLFIDCSLIFYSERRLTMVRVKKDVIPVPHNLQEAAKFLAKIGEEQRKVDAIALDLNNDVDKLKTSAMTKAKLPQEKVSNLISGLFAFAEAHRKELTNDGKIKTVKVPTGSFGWRMTPKSVSLRNVKSILEELKSLKLKRFIRIKEEVDKEAMLKESDMAETIKGVSIGQHEEFLAKPNELELEIVTNTKKLKKSTKVK